MSAEYVIQEFENGEKLATAPDSGFSLRVLPDSENTRVFKRNLIGMGEAQTSKKVTLVGELDGVRVYISGDQIIMSKQDLYE